MGVDVASLALRRVWERLESGALAITPCDVAALVRLQRETERERAPGYSDERWRATLRELLWLIRSPQRDDWPAFVRDVRASRALQDLWPRPGP